MLLLARDVLSLQDPQFRETTQEQWQKERRFAAEAKGIIAEKERENQTLRAEIRENLLTIHKLTKPPGPSLGD